MNVQDPPIYLEEELGMFVLPEDTRLMILESISGHVDLGRILRLNASPKELVLTCSMHESWEGWEKMMPGAQKERSGVEPQAMQEAAGIPECAGLRHAAKTQTNSRSLEAAKIGKGPLHSWN